MKVCYLVNQYPKVSHSFIRREIVELERQGASVLRIALRGWEQQLVDPADAAELVRTRYVLRSLLPLLAAVPWQLLRRPLRFARALIAWLALCRGSDKALLKHLACFVEACRAAGWVRAVGARHVHAHFGTNSAEVALLTAVLADVPYSFTTHGPEEFDHAAGLRLGEKVRRAAFVVTISSYGRSQLYRWTALDDWRKVAVVHCGLDAAFLDAPSVPVPDVPRFVCVARLNEQKGHLLLLEALRRVLDDGHQCHVVLAGDGELRERIEAYARELDVAGHLTITGWVDEQRVREEILAARALLLPSFAEGLPVVLMEALALARPAITTYVAGIPELLREGECGWLVPAGDAAALAQAMVDCLGRDAAALAVLGANGRARVRERHDIRVTAAQLLRLFRGTAA